MTRGRKCDNVVGKEAVDLIVYLDILAKLAARGWTAYRLRREGIIPESTLSRLRQGKDVTTATIDTVCGLLECQPGEILKWEPGE